MRTYTADEARTHLDELLDQAQAEPVRVVREGRLDGVVVSAEDYEAMRVFYASRLQGMFEESADEAERAGLTPEVLDKLLADES